MPEEFHEPVIFALKMFVSALEKRSDDELRAIGYPFPLDPEMAQEKRRRMVSRAVQS